MWKKVTMSIFKLLVLIKGGNLHRQPFQDQCYNTKVKCQECKIQCSNMLRCTTFIFVVSYCAHFQNAGINGVNNSIYLIKA